MGLRPMGVRTLDELPTLEETGPANARCCHGCGLARGDIWMVCTHDDLSLWQYPFCWDCHLLSLDWYTPRYKPDYADLTPIQQRFIDRVEQWNDNHNRLIAD